MKVEDLRIGNFINHNDDFHTVEEICFDGWLQLDNGQLNTYISECTPIDLIEKWIKRFGFVEKGNCFNFSRKDELGHEFGDFAISKYDDTQVKIWRGERYCGVVHCQFVHELQNLFFVLTGKELILKPEL